MSALLLVFQGSFATSAFAQEADGKPKKGPAYTAPPENDANYPLMGEFAGRVQVDGQQKRQPLALQIRPIAGNQFQAIAFRGGLPGQPNHESEEMRLIGLRSGDNLILSGGPWAIFVDADGCNLINSNGENVGRLKRVHRQSRTLGAPAPDGATVLFDGKLTEHLIDAKVDDEGLLVEGFRIRPMFQDFDLHVEFRLPYMPLADGQQRGNSGLYLQSRYECQVLDSFGTEKMFNGLGSLYRMKAPDLNMALPPLVWQTYDIHFTAPRWASDGTKIRDAHVTSWVNGVKVQDDVALKSKTGAGKEEAPTLSPIHVQDHGDPVRFRNLWIVDRGLTHIDFPVIATKQQRDEAAKLEWNEPPQPEPQDTAEDKPAEKTPDADNSDTAESKPDGDADKKADDQADQDDQAQQDTDDKSK
ncbi:DUF1080 domain-containing protein [Stieleria sp. TO1_6]|nr:DUF1080 domain-containing protein [Stieleria tagensis]